MKEPFYPDYYHSWRVLSILLTYSITPFSWVLSHSLLCNPRDIHCNPRDIHCRWQPPLVKKGEIQERDLVPDFRGNGNITTGRSKRVNKMTSRHQINQLHKPSSRTCKTQLGEEELWKTSFKWESLERKRWQESIRNSNYCLRMSSVRKVKIPFLPLVE